MTWRTIGIGLLALLAACTPAAPAPSSAPNGPTATGKPDLADNQKLTIGYTNLAPTMDPQTSTFGSYRKYDMFEALVINDEAGKSVEPMLAESWKTINPTTWRITLRPKSIFHDMSPLTADDVVFSWQRMNKPELKSPVPAIFTTVADVTKVDALNVDIMTKAPDPILLKRLGFFAVLPKAYIEKVGDTEFAAHPIGSGPFKFKEFKVDDVLSMTGFAEHPYRKPYLTDVTIKVIPDTNARVQGLELGELDMVHVLSVSHIEKMKNEGFPTLTRETAINIIYMDTWGPDGATQGPIADKRVRQAMSYAIDRDAMVNKMRQGVPKTAGTLLLPNWYGYNPDVKPYTYDVKKGKDLLAQAGYPNGFKVTLEFAALTQDIQDIMLFVQAAEKEIGVEVEFVTVDQVTERAKILKQRTGGPLFFSGSQISPLMDPESVFAPYWSGNTSAGKRYNNPEFDKVYLASREEMDPAKREKLLQQMEAILQDDPPAIGLYSVISISSFGKNIKGVAARPSEGDWVLLDKVYRSK